MRPSLPRWSTTRCRAGFSARGIDPDRLLGDGVDILNDVAATPGVRYALHLCRGNRDGHWMAAGGYEAISRQVFRRATRFDAFFLEYDDERSGGFEPLADLPQDRFVFLGLVSTKRPALEAPDLLLSRIEEPPGSPRATSSVSPRSAGSHRRSAGTRSTPCSSSTSCASSATSRGSPGRYSAPPKPTVAAEEC